MSGTIWANVMKRSDNPPRDVLLRELTTWLARERHVQLVGKLGFENAYALAMRRDRAARLGIRSISDLARHRGTLKYGGDFEFFARPVSVQHPALFSSRQRGPMVFSERRSHGSTSAQQRAKWLER